MPSAPSPTPSTINTSTANDSTTNLIKPSSATKPKFSLWQRLKAENETRKRNERQHVTPDEAKSMTGYGDVKQEKKYSHATEVGLIAFEYDPELTWGPGKKECAGKGRVAGKENEKVEKTGNIESRRDRESI